MSDLIVILILAVLAAWALYSCLRGRKEGGCSSCHGCCGKCDRKRD